MTMTFDKPPDLVDMEAMARESLTTIPEPLRRFLDGVVIRVEEFPDEDTEEELDLESPFDLLGL